MIGEVEIVSGQRSAAARVTVNLRGDCSVHHIFIEITGKDAKNAEKNIFFENYHSKVVIFILIEPHLVGGAL